MAVPTWFRSDVYFANKAAQTGMDSLALSKAFTDAGYNPNSVDSLYLHFVQHGNAENVSPNSYFNADEYLANKAADYFKTSSPSASQIQAMRVALAEAGMTPWDHYDRHGWEEGINPSKAMDTNQYMADKLAQMQATDPSYTMEQLVTAFKQSGYDPIAHYYAAGKAEGLVIQPADSGADPMQFLTPDRDNLIGGSGDDHFFAELGDLNNGDRIDGGDGYDVLEAYVGTSELAIHPWLSNIEKVALRAQHLTNDTGSNNPSLAAKGVNVDAENIKGMTYLQNERSRADLTVEDVTTLSTHMTIGMTNTDPGAVDFNVYFDPQALVSGDMGGVLYLRLMDVTGAQDTNGVSPLQENPYDRLTIKFNNELYLLDLKANTDEANYTGDTATYDTLVQAYRDALKAAVKADGTTVDLSNDIKITVGDPFIGDVTVGGTRWVSDAGKIINMIAEHGTIDASSAGTGFGASSVVPVDRGYAHNSTQTGVCPLIQTNIELDNVGRVKWADDNSNCLPADAIFGSKAGILEVGSMATTGGVERFDVTVDKGSWLEQMRSTNNTLRMIKAVNGAVDGVTEQDTINDKGQLFIGASLAAAAADGNLSDWNTNLDPRNPAGTTGKPGSWIDMPKLLNTNGLTDVKVFDASEMEGSVNIGAQITSQAYGKYLADVDGLLTVFENYAPLGGKNGEFLYTTGSAADTVNMIVDGSIAADRDFGLNILTNAGNDLINFSFNAGITANEVNNIARQLFYGEHYVTLDGGAGDDFIKSWGDGAVKAIGGAGDDAIYVGQNVANNAVLLFNVGGAARERLVEWDYINGAQHLDGDVLSSQGYVNYTGATVGRDITVTVNYDVLSSKAIRITTPTSADGILSMDVVNKAIIKAINEDPTLSKLFVAKDGGGYSLIIEALFDSELAAGDISFTLNYGALGGSLGTMLAGGTVLATEPVLAGEGHFLDSTLADNLIANVDVSIQASTEYAITINGEVYYASVPTTGGADTDLIEALQTAKTKAGNLLTDKYIVSDDVATTANIITITTKLGVELSDGDVTIYDLTNATNMGGLLNGADQGTTSRNEVQGGEGNDVLVLNNTSSSPLMSDVVVLHSNMGQDVIVNFQAKVGYSFGDIRDMFDARELQVNGAALNEATMINYGTSAAANNQYSALELAAAYTAAPQAINATGVGFVLDTTAGEHVYTVFLYNDLNGNNSLQADEVVEILGTVQLVDQTGLISPSASNVILA